MVNGRQELRFYYALCAAARFVVAIGVFFGRFEAIGVVVFAICYDKRRGAIERERSVGFVGFDDKDAWFIWRAFNPGNRKSASFSADAPFNAFAKGNEKAGCPR
jgi:hypothetical protein